MSRAENPGLPTDKIQDCRGDLETLANSDLPVAEYADTLLDVLEEEEQNQ